MFFTSKRYQDPVLWVWLEVVFTPKRYQDPVLWVWLEVVFTPKRYQDPVLWVWLEVFFTPKRCQDPVLWLWLENGFSLRGTNSYKTYLSSGFNPSYLLEPPCETLVFTCELACYSPTKQQVCFRCADQDLKNDSN